MNRLAILGASGHGKVVADTAELCGWKKIDFYDDAWPSISTNGPWPVVGTTQALLKSLGSYDGVFVAIGNNAVRQDKLNTLKSAGLPLVSIQHPAAIVSRYAQVGVGSVVMAGAVINVDASINDGAIINTGASVDHDCVLGDCVHISPGAHLAGGVKIGARSWVGIGASVKQLMTIGQNVIVGAAAAVVTDVPDNILVTGVPAKPISREV